MRSWRRCLAWLRPLMCRSTQPKRRFNASFRPINLPARKSARGAKHADQPPRTSWLTPYIQAWEGAKGVGTTGTMTGQLAKALKPLHDTHGATEVAGRLVWYLKTGDPKYHSITRFA